MLPKKERLSRVEFNRFFSVGKRLHTPLVQVVYVQYDKLHVSVVVPKKIAKLAVTRNKIRRRIYDIVRHYREAEQVTGVFIFLGKKGIQTATYQWLQHEVHVAIKDALKKFN